REHGLHSPAQPGAVREGLGFGEHLLPLLAEGFKNPLESRTLEVRRRLLTRANGIAPDRLVQRDHGSVEVLDRVLQRLGGNTVAAFLGPCVLEVHELHHHLLLLACKLRKLLESCLDARDLRGVGALLTQEDRFNARSLDTHLDTAVEVDIGDAIAGYRDPLALLCDLRQRHRLSERLQCGRSGQGAATSYQQDERQASHRSTSPAPARANASASKEESKAASPRSELDS